MKRFFRKTLLYCFFTIVVFGIPSISKAQGGPGGPGDPACDPQCNCYPDGRVCPIDDGVYLLLFAGLGYGLWKLRNSRKTNDGVYS